MHPPEQRAASRLGALTGGWGEQQRLARGPSTGCMDPHRPLLPPLLVASPPPLLDPAVSPPRWIPVPASSPALMTAPSGCQLSRRRWVAGRQSLLQRGRGPQTNQPATVLAPVPRQQGQGKEDIAAGEGRGVEAAPNRGGRQHPIGRKPTPPHKGPCTGVRPTPDATRVMWQAGRAGVGGGAGMFRAVNWSTRRREGTASEDKSPSLGRDKTSNSELARLLAAGPATCRSVQPMWKRFLSHFLSCELCPPHGHPPKQAAGMRGRLGRTTGRKAMCARMSRWTSTPGATSDSSTWVLPPGNGGVRKGGGGREGCVGA